MVSLWQHQIAAITLAKDRKGLALFFEQGTGKTLTALKILKDKCEQHGCSVLPTVILCPQIVIDNWKKEILAGAHFPADCIHTIKGTGKARARNLKALKGQDAIVITNYETLAIDSAFAELVSFGAKCIIFDESHKIKGLSSKRTHRAITLSTTATYRFILSGTPVVNSAFDLFPQFLAMDGGQAFGDNFKKFRSQYFYDENAGRPKHCYFPSWVPRTGALDAINKVVNANAVRVKKADCLDLPPLVKQRVYVDLVGGQRTAYDAIARDMVAHIDDKVVSTDMVLKQVLRLQQISSGFVKTDDGEINEFTKNPKVDALKELLSQIPNEKLIIWAVFKRDFVSIRHCLQELGIRSVEVHGEVSAAQKSHNVDDFESGTSGTRVLVGHPASAGIGINLVSASFAIFFSRTFSLENDLQAEARNYRGGSEIHQKVTRIDIVARETVDEVIMDALDAKQSISEVLINIKGKHGNANELTSSTAGLLGS